MTAVTLGKEKTDPASAATVPAKLTVPRMAGFAIGDYACNIYWQSLGLFLLFFYTDVVGIDPAMAGLIYGIASVFDAITDPIMGWVADRTRTRHGRYRPWILLGSVPLALSFAFLFYRPALEGMALILAVLAAHLLFRLCYTIVSIPYTSLTARITDDSRARGTVAGFRMLFATTAGLTVSAAMPRLRDALGGGDPVQGFFLAACCFAVLATLIFPIVCAATREPPEPVVPEPRLSLLDTAKALSKNRAFWVVMACVVVAALCSTVAGKSVLYWFKYAVLDPETGQVGNERAGFDFLALKAASGLLFVPFWGFVVHRMGKTGVWVTGCLIGAAAFASFAFLPVTDPWIAIAVFTAGQFGVISLWLSFWAMLPDTVEYGEHASGVRAESLTFGLGQFFLKVALGIASILFGYLLSGIGYVANQPQTPETLEGLRAMIAWTPVAALLGGAALMTAYPLSRRRHEALVAELKARRAGAAF